MASDVDICNMALSLIGEEPIRSLDETNRKAGLCKITYPLCRDSLLSKYAWGFAMTTAELSQLTAEHPQGWTYAIPNDCLAPKSLIPRGVPPYKWWREGQMLIIPSLDLSAMDEPVYLKYVKKCPVSEYFSPEFVEALYTLVASRICLPLTQDVKLAASITGQLRTMMLENAADEANADEETRLPDSDPENDSFVVTE